MRITPRLARFAASAAILLLVPPAASAGASAYSQVLAAYEQTGTVAACKFSSAELSNALKGVDTYGAQYFQDFTNAIQGALAARASGACVAGQPLALSRTPSARLHEPRSGSAAVSTQADAPAPIVILGVIAGLLALAGATFALFRARGWDPRWLGAWRHAWAEAGLRTGATWDEFRDWRRST